MRQWIATLVSAASDELAVAAAERELIDLPGLRCFRSCDQRGARGRTREGIAPADVARTSESPIRS